MGIESEAVGQVFKITLDGITYLFRAIETSSRLFSRNGYESNQLQNMLRYFSTQQDIETQVQGQASLKSVLQRGTGVSFFILREDDLQKFEEGVKNSSLLYCMSDKMSTQSGAEYREISVPRDQVDLLNKIIELQGIGTVERKGDIEPVTEKEAPEKSVPETSSYEQNKNADFLAKVEQLAEAENANPPRTVSTNQVEMGTVEREFDGSETSLNETPTLASEKANVSVVEPLSVPEKTDLPDLDIEM